VELSEFITRNPRICNGVPVFRNTRIPLRTILASLADGEDEESISEDFPTLTREHLRAAIAFAAASAVDDMPYAELPMS
jgi:uncharacterized protein (DUF433 family)